MPFQALINNLALLLALCVTYELIACKWRQEKAGARVLAGLVFGFVAIAGMMNAFIFSPGIIFDGRSVVLSVAGLFLGPITAATAAFLAGGYRFWLGGPGAFTGVLVIFCAAALGVVGFFVLRRKVRPIHTAHLILFGIIVHALLFPVIITTLPSPAKLNLVQGLALPFLTILPLGTLLLGKLLDDQNRRRSVEESLSESQVRLAQNNLLLTSLIDSIPELIFYKDRESVFLGCNQAFAEFLGYPQEEIIGRTDHDFFPWELADFFQEKDREMLAGGLPRRNEEWVENAAGRKVLLDTLKTPYLGPDGGGLGLIGISRDITAEKAAAKAVRDSARLLSGVFDSIQDGISVLDTELNIIKVNHKMNSLYSDRQPLAGAKCYQAYRGKEQPCEPCPSVRAIQSGKLEVNEVPYVGPAGTQGMLELYAFPMTDEEGNLTGVVEYVRDITQRRKAQEEKERAIERFQLLVDSLDALVYVVDLETHELLFVNEYGRKIWGEIVGGICWQKLQGTQDGPCSFCTNDKLVDQEGKPAGIHVWEFQNTVNKEWYECRDQAIRWTDGRLVRMEIATNITARRQAEQERKLLEAQLRQAQKMEAIGTLAGGIAHDFNNMLVPILAFSELLMNTEPADSPRKQDLHEILKAARRARDLVKQILVFSRQTEHELKPLLIGPVLKENLKLVTASLPSNIEVRLDLRATESKILGDPTQVSQIILNLCTNAYQAMLETGGVLEISLTECDLPDRQDLPLTPGRYLKLAVRDTGGGISQAEQAKIFEPYYTTKKPGAGTGLGLAVVHGIVTKYKGAVCVSSSPGQGATFEVYLPLLQGERKSPPGTPSILSQELPPGTEHILLVDDEKPVLCATRRILEYLGYRVTAQTSSTRALELFQQSPEQFDLVLSDVTMPYLTGDQLAKSIRLLNPEIPIILCTGYSSIIDEARAEKLQIAAFLLKPLPRQSLAKAVRDALDTKGRKRVEPPTGT